MEVSVSVEYLTESCNFQKFNFRVMSLIRVQVMEILLHILLVLELSWITCSFQAYEPAKFPGWHYFGYTRVEPQPSVVFRKPMAAMVDLTNNLGVAILQDYAYSRSNFAFSPYGVASVLVVLYEGARGESARQIHEAVNFPWDRDITRIGFRDIHRHLRSYFSHEGYLSGITLSKEGSTLKPEYKRILRFYGYDVEVDVPERTSEVPFAPATTEPVTSNTTSSTTTTTSAASTGSVPTTGVTTASELTTEWGSDVTTTREPVTEETNIATTSVGSATPPTGDETTATSNTGEEEDGETPSETVTVAVTTSAESPEERTTTESQENTMPATATTTTTTTTVQSEVTPAETATTTAQESTSPEISATITTVRQEITSPETTTVRQEITSPEISATITTVRQEITSPETAATTTTVREEMTSAETTTETVQQEVTAAETAAATVMTTVQEVTSASTTTEGEAPEPITGEPGGEVETTSPGEPSTGTSDGTSLSATEEWTEGTTTADVTERELAEINEVEDVDGNVTSQEVTEKSGNYALDNGMLIPQGSADDHTLETTPGITREHSGKRNLIDDLAQIESSSDGWREFGASPIVAEGDRVEWEPKTLEEFLMNLKAAGEGYERASNRTRRAAEWISSRRKSPPGWYGKDRSLNGQKRGKGAVGSGKAVPVDFKTSATFKERQKTRTKRTISEFLKVPPITDLSLQLQNGMFDSHVSKDTNLYRALPKFLFLVDGAIDTPVPMMTYTNIFPFAYIPRLHCKALEFPLDDERYKLLILLPVERRGLRQLIYDLNSYPLREVIEVLRLARVKATVPTFMVEGFVILTPTLQKLGIWDVFDPRRADLSAMSTDPELYVRNIEQSVTVVIRNYVEILDIQTRTMAARDIDEDFTASHPFLYFVMDTTTNVALMAGQMLDPLNSRIY